MKNYYYVSFSHLIRLFLFRPNCEKAFYTPAERRKHHDVHLGVPKERKFACSWENCERRFTEKKLLMRHVRYTHENPKSFECTWPGCESKYNEECSLIKHEKSHMKLQSTSDEMSTDYLEKFKCDWPGCEGIFTTPSGLRAHRFCHLPQEERRLGCVWPGCTYRTNSRRVLNNHMHLHTG